MQNELLTQAIQEKKKLEKLEMTLMKSLKHAPTGVLHIKIVRHKYHQYYLVADGKEQYLKSKDLKIAKKLAQRDYEQHLLKLVEERLRIISKLIRCYESGSLAALSCQMPEGRKRLVDMLIPEDEQYIEKWKSQFKICENAYEMINVLETDKGEFVRSKSEKIIADQLYHYGIPYVYEPTLIFKDGSKVFPDFAVLNVSIRRAYYIEHFGMMDNPDYSNRVVKKIDEYAKQGYFLGKNLLCTFETKDNVLDLKALDRLIREYLL